MKKLILSALAALFISHIHAQVTISPLVGLNISGATVKTGSTSDINPGLFIGALADFPLGNNWSLQTGLLYKKGGYHCQNYSVKYMGTGGFADIRTTTFDVPVYVTYTFSISKGRKIFIGAGPYLTPYGVIHVDYYNNRGESVGWERSGRQEIGAGLNAGLRTRWGLLACLQGQYGWQNLGELGAVVHGYNLAIAAGYTFKLNRHERRSAKSETLVN